MSCRVIPIELSVVYKKDSPPAPYRGTVLCLYESTGQKKNHNYPTPTSGLPVAKSIRMNWLAARVKENCPEDHAISRLIEDKRCAIQIKAGGLLFRRELIGSDDAFQNDIVDEQAAVGDAGGTIDP